MISHANNKIQKFIDTDCAVVAVIALLLAVAIVFSLAVECGSRVEAFTFIFHFWSGAAVIVIIVAQV